MTARDELASELQHDGSEASKARIETLLDSYAREVADATRQNWAGVISRVRDSPLGLTMNSQDWDAGMGYAAFLLWPLEVQEEGGR
jgi:hypothetical protein